MLSKYLKISIVGVGGMALLIFCTSRYGVGVGPDSVVYLSAAENLLKGLGFSALSGLGETGPMTRFPPLYPALLAAAGLAGMSLEAGARWLNVFLFGANIILVGVMVARYSRSTRLAVFAALLMMFSADMLHVHSMVMTEALFIFFTLLTVFCSASYYENERLIFLSAAAGAAAMAVLTRYAGVALVAAAAAGILFLAREKRLRARVAGAALFAGISLVPVLLWVLRNLAVAGNAADRIAVFHPVGFKAYTDALLTCAAWLAPVRISAVAGAFVLLLEASALFILWRLSGKNRSPEFNSAGQNFAQLPALLVYFIISYSGLLLVTMTFFDAGVSALRVRIMSLFYPACLILAVCFLYQRFYPIKNTRIFKTISAAASLMLAGYYLFSGAIWAADIYANGQRYNGKVWEQSDTMRAVRQLPMGSLIYTNGPDVIKTLTGRSARRIPAKEKHQTRLANVNYVPEIARMTADLSRQRGVLVYFYAITSRPYLPSEEELQMQLPLRIVSKHADGCVYSIKK